MATPQLPRQAASQPPGALSAPGGHTSMADHSFTLQAIMEMQKSIGSIGSKMDAVCDRMENLETRMGKMEDTVSGITHKIYAAGIVLAILVAIGGFIVDKAVDVAVDQIKAKAETGKRP